MREIYLLILKSLLWVVIMLLLRPLNALLDACFARYVTLLDDDDVANFRRVNWTAVAVVSVLVLTLCGIIFLIHIYG